MATEWFAVPPVSSADFATGTTAKYLSDVDWCGQVVNMDNYNVSLSGDWYVCEVTASQSAIDSIAAYDDAYGKTEQGYSDQEMADWLNQHFSGLPDRTWSEWQEHFF